MNYKDIKTGEIVNIVKENTSFITLNNGLQILKSIFDKKFVPLTADDMNRLKAEIDLNVSTLNEQIKHNISNMGKDSINPDEFFNSPLSIPVKQIKESLNKVNTSNLVDIPDSQKSVVQIIQPVDGGTITMLPEGGLTLEQKAERLKEELKRQNFELKSKVNPEQYKQIDENDDSAINNFVNNNQTQRKKNLNENGLTPQQEEIRQNQIQLNGVDPFKDKIEKFRGQKLQEAVNTQQELQTTINNNPPVNSTVTYQLPQQEDDDTRVFRKFKRSYPITLNIKVDDKIAKPEFVRLMAEGYESDIIRFYAKDIIKNILSDIKGLEDKIYNQIDEIVNPDKPKVVIPKVKSEDREKLQEGVEKKTKTVKKTTKKKIDIG